MKLVVAPPDVGLMAAVPGDGVPLQLVAFPVPLTAIFTADERPPPVIDTLPLYALAAVGLNCMYKFVGGSAPPKYAMFKLLDHDAPFVDTRKFDGAETVSMPVAGARPEPVIVENFTGAELVPTVVPLPKAIVVGDAVTREGGRLTTAV